MRKALFIGFPILLLLAFAGLFYKLHNANPIANARARMARNDMRGAKLYLQQALQLHPKSAEAAFLLGRADLATGNPIGAEIELDRARDRGYSPAAIVMPLGEAYLQQRHYTELLRDFTADKAPAGALGQTLALRAAAQLSLGQLPDATESAAAAEKAAPNDPETLLIAARVALARGDLDGVLSRVNHALAADPKQPDALLLRAEVDLRRNDPKAALAGAQAVLSTLPDRLDALMIQARADAVMGHDDQARAAVQHVLKIAPKDVSANYFNAMLAIGAGDYPTADKSLTIITTVLDQLPRGFYFLAVTKLGMGQPALAEEADSKFLAKAPDDLAAVKLMAFIDLARRHPDRTMDLLHKEPLSAHVDSVTLDLQGRAQTMMGQMKAAKQSFTDALALAPKDVQILNRLAATELDLGETNLAEQGLHASLKMAPDQRLAGEALVQADLARGDIPQANKDVERLRKAIGNAEEVGVLAAQVKIAGLDTDAGAAELRDVLSRFPDSRPATMTLVRIEGLRGNAQAVEKLLEDRLHRHPADLGALNLLLPVLFADHQVDLAVALAEAAHTTEPDDIGITEALADVYVRDGEQGRAVALLDRVSAGTDPKLDLLRAHVLAAADKTDQAIAAYQNVLQEQPANMQARGELAGLMVRAQHYDDARTMLKDGLSQYPGNPLLLGALVGVDFKDGGLKPALAEANTLLADPQNHPAADGLIGDTYMIAGDIKQAAQAYLAAFKATPSAVLAAKAAGALSSTGDNAQAITLLGGFSATHPDDIGILSALSTLYLNANQLVQAEAALTRVLAARPRDVVALNNLAWVRQKQGQAAEALALAERAYFETPLPDIADTLGWILVQQGQTDKAMMVLAQAVHNPNPDSQALAEYHYGYALNQAGQHDRAVQELTLAVNAKANFVGKDDARKLLTSLK